MTILNLNVGKPTVRFLVTTSSARWLIKLLLESNKFPKSYKLHRRNKPSGRNQAPEPSPGDPPENNEETDLLSLRIQACVRLWGFAGRQAQLTSGARAWARCLFFRRPRKPRTPSPREEANQWKSNPPTPTRAPDNQSRKTQDQPNSVRNTGLLNLWGLGRGFLFHRWRYHKFDNNNNSTSTKHPYCNNTNTLPGQHNTKYSMGSYSIGGKLAPALPRAWRRASITNMI